MVEWVFGDAMCKLVHFVIYSTLLVTVWTLVSIAVLRHHVVVRGKKSSSKRRCKPLMVYSAALWLAMAGLSVPFALLAEEQTSAGYTFCDVSDGYKRVLAVTLLLAAYCLPLLIITLAYLLIIRYLLRLERGTQRRARGLQACKRILTVVTCFLLAWLPQHVYALVTVFASVTSAAGVTHEVIAVACHVCAFSNSLANPFIYSYVCEDFRLAFRERLPCPGRHCSLAHKGAHCIKRQASF